MTAVQDEIDFTAYYHVAYENHGIMNPLSPERYLAIAGLCGLDANSRVLDIGSGNGSAALLLAETHGCTVDQVDASEKWTARAERLFAARGMEARTTITCMDAAKYPVTAGAYQLIVCLGTAQIFGGFRKALAHLGPGLRDDGCIIIAEPSIDVPIPRTFASYLREEGWDIPATLDYMRIIGRMRFDILGVFRSTPEEWDAYMALQWKSVHDFSRANPGNPDAAAFTAWAREEQEMYLRHQRHLMNWDVYVLRKGLQRLKIEN